MADHLPTDVASRAHQIIATIIICTILSTLFIVVRLFTRYFVNRSVGWDDYVALGTLPFVIAYGVILGINTRYGMGLHQHDMPESLVVEYYKWIDIGAPFYLLSLFGYKMSILLLYVRIFGVNRPFRYATYVTMFIVFAYLFSNIWTQLFGCHPFDKEYAKKKPGHCIDYEKADYAYGSLNCITDMMLFILPLPMIRKLQINLKEKIGIGLIFAVGSLNWAVAIVRFVWAVEDLTAPDRTWLAAETFLWSIIEVNTGLICSCVPVLKPFFRRIVPKTLSERSRSLGKERVSSTENIFRPGDEDRKHNWTIPHIDDLELQRETLGVPGGGRDRSWDSSVSTVVTRAGSEGKESPPPVPPKDHDLDDAKYGVNVADI